MKIKLSDRNICVFLMTLLVFLDMNPYFVWNQISLLGYRIYTGLILIATAWLAYIMLNKSIIFGKAPALMDTNKIYAPFFAVSFGIVLLFFYEVLLSGVVGGTSQPFNAAQLCIHIGLMLFCVQDNMTLRRIFLNSKTIFAITLIPALAVFFLLQIGIQLPYALISADAGKELTGQAYRLYLGSATMLQSQGELLPRLCGIYQEPGFVGTVGAFFLIGDELAPKKWQNIVIFIASICTFSLAFIVLFVIGWVLRILARTKNKKNALAGFVAVVAVIVGYFVFMNLPFDPSTELGELQERLAITDEGLAGDNRISGAKYAEEAYESFLQSDLKTILLGYGKDMRTVPGTNYGIWQHAHSYKEFIFSFGFLGFGILILFFALAVSMKYKNVMGINKNNIRILLALFLFSIYQRYSVDQFYYFCLLFGGASNLALMHIGNQTDFNPTRNTRKQTYNC